MLHSKSIRALTDEQVALVRSWCTSGHRAQGAIGRAGTGKTTTMRAAGSAWPAAGYRVIGAAVKGEAARKLAATPTSSNTRTILIVDEASTLGDRDLDAATTAKGIRWCTAATRNAAPSTASPNSSSSTPAASTRTSRSPPSSSVSRK